MSKIVEERPAQRMTVTADGDLCTLVERIGDVLLDLCDPIRLVFRRLAESKGPVDNPQRRLSLREGKTPS